MAGSGNKKRRKAQQQQAQHHAEKRRAHERSHQHEHLPKVGTPDEQAYLLRRRRADLVDFGRIPVGRAVAVALAVLAVVALVAFFALT